MRRLTTIIYILLWTLNIVAGFVLFPVLNDNVLIPILFLIPLGAWLYGRRTGLIMALIGMVSLCAVTTYYADISNNYVNRLICPILAITTVFIADILRQNITSVQSTNRTLDRIVWAREETLKTLIDKILINSEQLRVKRGEEIHDGIGQQLTGLRLLCSSLQEQLELEENPAAPTIKSMNETILSTHNSIRTLARILFPVRMNQVGLFPALMELCEILKKIKQVDISIQEMNEITEIPEQVALQMYRICQETAVFIIEKNNASCITIRLGMINTEYYIEIDHNGIHASDRDDQATFGMIRYRLSRLSGTWTQSISEEGLTRYNFLIPKKTSRKIQNNE